MSVLKLNWFCISGMVVYQSDLAYSVTQAQHLVRGFEAHARYNFIAFCYKIIFFKFRNLKLYLIF